MNIENNLRHLCYLQRTRNLECLRSSVNNDNNINNNSLTNNNSVNNNNQNDIICNSKTNGINRWYGRSTSECFTTPACIMFRCAYSNFNRGKYLLKCGDWGMVTGKGLMVLHVSQVPALFILIKVLFSLKCSFMTEKWKMASNGQKCWQNDKSPVQVPPKPEIMVGVNLKICARTGT